MPRWRLAAVCCTLVAAHVRVELAALLALLHSADFTIQQLHKAEHLNHSDNEPAAGSCGFCDRLEPCMVRSACKSTCACATKSCSVAN